MFNLRMASAIYVKSADVTDALLHEVVLKLG